MGFILVWFYTVLINRNDDKAHCTLETKVKRSVMSKIATKYTCIYSVSQKTPRVLLTLFRKRLGIFSPNFTCLLHVSISAGLQIFIQLSATLTKLCHIKRDHHHAQNVHHRPKHTLVFSDIFRNNWKFLVQILHTCYPIVYVR